MAQLKSYYVTYTAKIEYQVCVVVEATSETQAKAKAENLREFELQAMPKFPENVEIYMDGNGCEFELEEIIED